MKMVSIAVSSLFFFSLFGMDIDPSEALRAVRAHLEKTNATSLERFVASSNRIIQLRPNLLQLDDLGEKMRYIISQGVVVNTYKIATYAEGW